VSPNSTTSAGTITLYTPPPPNQTYSHGQGGQVCSPGNWEGRVVWVYADWPCPEPEHRLYPLKHYGIETGQLICQWCCGVTDVVQD
jgi:hypothetical protein